MISASVTGLEGLYKKLFNLKSSSVVEDALDEAMASLLNRIKKRFLDEMNPDGTPWVASKAGLKRKAGGYTYRNKRKYTGTGTLFETGTLWASIQAYSGTESNERIISTDVDYAKDLQKSETEGPWVFLAFSDDDLTLFEKIVLRKVNEVLA